MEEQKIIESNKLIAEFMGFKKVDYLWHTPIRLVNKYPKSIFEGDNTNSFRFHESWDWIMPVCKKIFDIREEEDLGNCDGHYFTGAMKEGMGRVDVDMVFYNVCGFIKWYNSCLAK